MKILKEGKKGAEVVLLNVGKKQGVKNGDSFVVSYVEILEGEPYPTELGEIKVSQLKGDAFSECEVPKKVGNELKARFVANEKIICNLKVE